MKTAIKRYLAFLMALVLCFSLMPNAFAAELNLNSEDEELALSAASWNTVWEQSSDPGEMLANFAKAQVGKSPSELGVPASLQKPNTGWCAWFIWNCAEKIGIHEDVIPHEDDADYYAYLNAGGIPVDESNVKAGDIVFYKCSVDGGWKHAGICIDSRDSDSRDSDSRYSDSRYSIEGSVNGTVEKIDYLYHYYLDDNGEATGKKCYDRYFVRPNYSGGAPYDGNKAANFAKAHYNDGYSLCTTFALDCLKQGGIDFGVNDCFVHKRLTTEGYADEYKLNVESNGLVKIANNKGIISPGDTVTYYCNTCSSYPHIVVVSGIENDGYVYSCGANPGLGHSKLSSKFTSGYHVGHNISLYVAHIKNNTASTDTPTPQDISVSFTTDNTRQSIGETDATLAMTVRTSGTSITSVSDVGMELYDANGNLVKYISEIESGNKLNYENGYMIVYYGINKELKVTLSSGTAYKYRFFAKINEKTYYSDMLPFTTTGTPADKTPPQIGNVRISDRSQTGYKVSCDVTDNVGVSRVQFPTWTQDNQSDLIWLDGTHEGGNTYSVRINFSDFACDTVFITHIYAYDNAENPSSIGTDAIWPDKDKPVVKSVKAVNGSENGFNVECEVSDNQGLSSVRVAVWTAQDQADLVWKDASLTNGKYVVNVPYSEHNTGSNIFLIHVYAYDLWHNEGFNGIGINKDDFNTYTISYDANGGSGAPEAQNKNHGQTLTLSNTVPTRDGYTFLGWATTSDAASVQYKPGDNFSENADTTLYAIWQKIGALGVLASGECGDKLTWIVTDDGVLTISGAGNMWDFQGAPPWYAYRYVITSVKIPNTVTSIGYDAFAYCEGLTSVTVPDSVTYINDGAFYYCYGLTSITIGSNAATIGNYAFCDCYNLKSITIGSGITNIFECAFVGCGGLTDIFYSGNAEAWGKISIGPGNDALSNVTIHYNHTPPTYTVASGECGDNLTWTLDNEGMLTISGTGAMWDFDRDDEFRTLAPWGEYADDILSFVISSGVTSLGTCAFWKCENLTEVSLSDSVTLNNTNPFLRCPNLAEINVSPNNAKYCSVNGVVYSKDMSEIVICPNGKSGSFTIPGSVESILENAFCFCRKLTNIDIPSSVTFIGSQAFLGCDGLVDENGFVIIRNILYHFRGDQTDISIPYGVTYISGGVFQLESITSVVIPDSVTGIGEGAFYKCEKLKSIVLPDSVTSIGQATFGDCYSLEEIVLSNNLRNIGEWAFQNCTSLKKISIPGSVKQIEHSAFLNCTALEDVTISYGVETIDYAAFIQCYSLKSIELPDSVMSLGEAAFGNCTSLEKVILSENLQKIDNWEFQYCTSLTEITIPDSVQTIGMGAFYECTGLADVTIGGSVTVIDEAAFYGCTGLTFVKLPNDLTSLGVAAFNNCSGLTDIEIPAGITSIGDWAFDFCSSLTSVYYAGSESDWSAISIGAYNKPLTDANIICKDNILILPADLKKIDKEAFMGVTAKVIIVPATVTEIGSRAFADCKNLRQVIFHGTPDSIAKDYLEGSENAVEIKQ